MCVSCIVKLSVDERVANGVEWLDENGPAEWWDRIDTETLDINDGNDCVLGQVFAAEANEHGIGSGYGYVAVFNKDEWGMHQPQRFGFCSISDSDDYKDCRRLADMWTAAVEDRRALVNA
jgi:hypothetical protein